MRTTIVNVWFCRAVLVLGWALMLAGFALIAAECLLWLRNGYWTGWPLREALSAIPNIRDIDPHDWMVMRGAHRIIRWIGSIPTSVALLVAGMGLAWNANGWLEKTEARTAERIRRVRS